MPAASLVWQQKMKKQSLSTVMLLSLYFSQQSADLVQGNIFKNDAQYVSRRTGSCVLGYIAIRHTCDRQLPASFTVLSYTPWC